MRRHRFFLLIFTALLSMSLVTESCKRDKCKKVVCTNGECVDGECICATGFGGSDCGTPLNQRFTGTFGLAEICTAGSDAYDVFVEPLTGSNDQIRIAGLWDSPRDTVIATVAANGTDFSIARIAYAGREIEGNGTLNDTGSAGTIEYSVYGSFGVDACAATFELK